MIIPGFWGFHPKSLGQQIIMDTYMCGDNRSNPVCSFTLVILFYSRYVYCIYTGRIKKNSSIVFIFICFNRHGPQQEEQNAGDFLHVVQQPVLKKHFERAVNP